MRHNRTYLMSAGVLLLGLAILGGGVIAITLFTSSFRRAGTAEEFSQLPVDLGLEFRSLIGVAPVEYDLQSSWRFRGGRVTARLNKEQASVLAQRLGGHGQVVVIDDERVIFLLGSSSTGFQVSGMYFVERGIADLQLSR